MAMSVFAVLCVELAARLRGRKLTAHLYKYYAARLTGNNTTNDEWVAGYYAIRMVNPPPPRSRQSDPLRSARARANRQVDFWHATPRIEWISGYFAFIGSHVPLPTSAQ